MEPGPDLPERQHVLRQVVSHRAVQLIVPLAITALAMVVLHKMFSSISLACVGQDVRTYSSTALLLSVGAMCVSYLALSLYDVILLRGVTEVKLPLGIPMMTGFSSMAVSNLLGFSWLTGGAIRYRIYSGFGVDMGAVARIIATSWIGFFIGVITLIGALMVFHPTGLSQVFALSDRQETVIGVSVLTAIAAGLVWTAKTHRKVGFGAYMIELPLASVIAKITLVSVIDLGATALTLYVLMPADLAQNFVFFFVMFVAAVGLGIISHSPGGLGVFEATILTSLGATGRTDALAALVVYRLIYTLLPFFVAVLGLVVAWAIANRQKTEARSKIILKAIGPIIPAVAAALVLLSGLVLLVSGTLPSDPARLGFLREVLPLPLVETSHLLGSIAGALLLIVARGLFRRMFRAWLLAMALLFVGLVLSILKGVDWEEAVSLAAAMAVLWVFRAAFYRADVASGLRLSWPWIASVAVLAAISAWIGFFAYSNVQYSDALWWQFAWHGDASRYMRATLAVAVVLAAAVLNMLLSKQSTRLTREPIPDVVRSLTKASSNAEAGISLSGDKRFLISKDARAYIAYADTGNTLVSKGDPIGDNDAGIAAIWMLRELADKMGRRCAFYGVSERYLPTYLDLGLQVLKIGEVARVGLTDFTLEGARRKDWRHAKARIARDGYRFEVISAADTGPIMDNLREVSDSWLNIKKSEEKGFSLGWFHPDYIQNFDIATLRNVETGRITAFANLMQAGDKSELSLDLMRYDPSGPSVAMDALFAEMMLWGKEQGFAWFSLGAAPLSGLETRHLAPLWHRIGGLLYEYGGSFYHFEGLRSFKQKFDPVWSSEYLASSGRLDAARVLYEVSLLVSRGAKGMKKHGADQ